MPCGYISTVSWRKNNTAAGNIAKLLIFLCILDSLIAQPRITDCFKRAKRMSLEIRYLLKLSQILQDAPAKLCSMSFVSICPSVN